MANVVTVSTDNVSTTDKFAFWREKNRELFEDSRLTLPSEFAFQGSHEYADLGHLQLTKLKVSPHSVERARSQRRLDDKSCVMIVFQVKGCFYFETNARDVVLSPGEWCIIDVGPSYRLMFPPGGVEQLTVVIPREHLPCMDLQNHLCMRSFSSRDGLGRLTYELLNATFSELPNLCGHSERSAVSTIDQLLNYSILEFLGEDRSPSFKEALYARALSYIMQNARDPDLNVGQVASALRCSKRYLHMVFADKRNTLDESIWKLRLDGCKKDLQNPRLAAHSIMDVAFSWGFNNYPHFSRKFKDEFGGSPRSLRAKSMESK
jgi:AraC family transcriptional activator of tynA and feaB